MQTIHARELLKVSAEEVMVLLDGGNPQTIPLTVVFDDGELVTNNRATIYSSFAWDFQRQYPDTPLTMDCHLGKRRVTSGRHLDLMGPGFWACADLQEPQGLDIEELDALAYASVNKQYNFAVTELAEYAEPLDYDDYIAVTESPLAKQALDTVSPNRTSITRTQDVVKQALMNADDLKRNPLADFVRSEFLRTGQVLKCVAPIGYVTEVDSTFFERRPVMKGYVQGVDNIYESAIESRGASKALKYSIDHVEKGEYFNRKMQLGCSVIEHLFEEDCGTDRLLTLEITGNEDLELFDGAYRETAVGLVPIYRHNRHLIGQTVRVRNPIHCNNLHQGGICKTCMGELGRSIPRGSNLGHVSSSVLCMDASQSILSVKHEDSTNVATDVILGDLEQDYLEVTIEDTSQVRLKRLDYGTNQRLVIEARYLRNLKDIAVAPDLAKLSPPNTTSIHDVELWYVDSDGFEQVVKLTVANGARMASLTYEALGYCREKEWELSQDGRYIFDLSDWVFEHPMFVLPVKHANMIEFINDIETYVRSSGAREITEHRDRLINHVDLEKGLLQFADLISTKLKVNIAHLAVIVASTTARSSDDYRLPTRASDGIVVSYEELIRGRSLSCALAYEHLERIYGEPSTYLVAHRQGHPMDALMRETLQEESVADLHYVGENQRETRTY